jgi:hypothetical protein
LDRAPISAGRRLSREIHDTGNELYVNLLLNVG